MKQEKKLKWIRYSIYKMNAMIINQNKPIVRVSKKEII